jgi:hypothetical protein
MPHKNPETERFGGPGSSRQDRKHPEKSEKQPSPAAGEPTSGRAAGVSSGGGERDKHHSHDPRTKS